MPGADRSIFNKKATEKLRNPDELDKYLRVTNPSVWVILAACIALAAGLLSWGFLGSVTTSVSATGVVENDSAMCFLGTEDAVKVHVGDSAYVGGESMKVSEISAVPVSKGEAGSILISDYLVSTLVQGDWAYWVMFEGDTSDLVEGVPLETRIVVERVAPISLILGGKA